MSQRARILWIVALAIAPLVALSAARIWQELREAQAQVAASRLQLAQLAAFATAAFLDGHIANARSVALHPGFARQRPGAELDALVRRVAAQQPEWEGLGVVGPDGISIAGSRGAAPVYLGDRPYLRQALATGRPAVSSALIGRLSGKTTVVIAVPLAPADGEGRALIVPLPTDRFGASLRARLAAPSLALTVIDAQGQAFIRPDPEDLTSLRRLDGPEVSAVLAGEAGTRVAGAGAAARLVAYAPVAGYGWGVLLAEPAAGAFAPARRQALEQAGVLAAILAAVAALGWLLAGRVSLYFERAERLALDLHHALRTRDEFLAAAAHDLRNPLSTIQAAAEVLERGAARSGAVAQESLRRSSTHILSAARRMARLIEGFLDVAHLQIGRPLELDRRPADLAVLVRQAVQEFQQASSRHRIAYEGPESLEALVDGARLARALENLIGNAIKYSPEGGDIRVRLQSRGPEVLLAVEDHGIGVDPADRERVFRRFERGANAAGRFSGTGLGLSIAREIVERHGGSLALDSELGRGSTFTLHFPALRTMSAEGAPWKPSS